MLDDTKECLSKVARRRHLDLREVTPQGSWGDLVRATGIPFWGFLFDAKARESCTQHGLWWMSVEWVNIFE